MKNRSSFNFRRTFPFFGGMMGGFLLTIMVIPYFSACKDDKSGEKELTNLTVRAGTTDFPAQLQSDGKTWNIDVPYDFNQSFPTSVTVTFDISKKATANPASGASVNSNFPVNILVTAEDGTMETYPVTKTVGAPSNLAAFTSFKLTVGGQEFVGAIDAANRKVTFATQVPYPKRDARNGAVPSFEVTAGATANPVSGTARDFTGPLSYAITAQDGSTEIWTVEMGVAPPQSFSEFDGLTGLWEFNEATNLGRATVGNVMKFLSWVTKDTPSIPTANPADYRRVDGINANDKAIEKEWNVMFFCDHGIEIEGEAEKVSQWSILFDVKILEAFTSNFGKLTMIQTDITNKTGLSITLISHVREPGEMLYNLMGTAPKWDTFVYGDYINVNTWHRIIYVVDFPNVKTYVDGVLRLEYEATSEDAKLHRESVFFHAHDGGEYMHKTHISTIAVFGKPLTGNEVELMNDRNNLIIF